MCEALTFLMNIIYIRFGTRLFRQIVGIFRRVLSAHRLWLICSYSVMKKTSCCLFLKNSNLVIEVFSSTSRYLDDLSNTDNNFDGVISQIYLSEP